MNINLKLDKINKSFQKSLLNQTDPEQMKVLFLGRKAELNEILKNIKTLPADERMSIGAKANLLKKEIETKIANFTSSKQEKSFYDLTLPAALNLTYSVHPLRQIQNEIVEIFTDLGFEVASGPEIESDWYNFEALNIHANHPARDDQDSFYINREQLLRTQTSPVQIRVLEKSKPPVRIICPGKTFRRDASDATHTSMFHQIEGLVVDEDVTFADLKGILIYAAKKLFGENVKTRFRISYFPFVEPGAEMDISCTVCGAKSKTCPVCKGTGWIEIVGCGSVHPNVIKNAGLNPKQYQGIAFGMALERPLMIKYQIKDIRLFFENDIRFLTQFP
ncbi:MAG: hypothetical protein ACD_83C00221G0003 [uncultured bacterium]|nr:MAG: hypothetical protein ACD_83C00221G0003 [uncultured bacterium]